VKSSQCTLQTAQYLGSYWVRHTCSCGLFSISMQAQLQIHEGIILWYNGHNNSSANRQNDNSGILEQGGDAVTITVLIMTVGNMENTYQVQQWLTVVVQPGQWIQHFLEFFLPCWYNFMQQKFYHDICVHL